MDTESRPHVRTQLAQCVYADGIQEVGAASHNMPCNLSNMITDKTQLAATHAKWGVLCCTGLGWTPHLNAQCSLSLCQRTAKNAVSPKSVGVNKPIITQSVHPEHDTWTFCQM